MENNNSIGALWIKESQKGDFFTGHIINEKGEKIKIIIFKNNFKNKETQPDYTILKAREIKQQENQEELTDENDLPF